MRKRAVKIKQLQRVRNENRADILNEAIVEIEKRIMDSHDRERKENESKAIEKITNNSKYFFSYASKFSTAKSKIGPLINNAGKLVDDNKEMSEILSEQYSSVFSTPMSTVPTLETTSTRTLTDITIGVTEIAEAIDEIGTNSSPGPDDIPAILLKKCKEELLEPLQLLWQKSLEHSDIPEEMKHAVIFPLAKGGSLSSPSN